MESDDKDSSIEESLKDPPAAAPVFFDENRRRWPWFMRASISVAGLVGLGALALVVSLIAVPLMPPPHLPRVAPVREVGNADPPLSDYSLRKLDVRQSHEARDLKRLNAERDKRRQARRAQAELFLKTHKIKTGQPVVAGFYVDWEQGAETSLRANIDALTHIVPEWLHLEPAGYNYASISKQSAAIPFVDAREKRDITDILPLAHHHSVSVVALINNYTRPLRSEEGAGNWDPVAVHQLVSNPAARASTIAHLKSWLVKEKMQGICIDFENPLAQDEVDLVQFMRELSAALHPAGLLVTQVVQVDTDGFDLGNLAETCDWIVPRFFDQHSPGDPAGPVASLEWTKTQLADLLDEVPPNKIVMGFANQAYDWPDNDKRNSAESLDYQAAMGLARDTAPDSIVTVDPKSTNPVFSYTATPDDAETNGQRVHHTVWMLDAVTAYNQLTLAKEKGVRGAGLWFLGSEDPGLWSFLHRDKWLKDWKPIIQSGSLATIQYGTQGQVEFEGDGELLLPTGAPAAGARAIKIDPRTGQITDETYLRDPATGAVRYPAGWTVHRYGAGAAGNPAKQIVLTFDDGPDPEWTPKILDILKQYHVPACFFVVGKLAEEHPDLIRRMWDEGHEIGNHSWDHPDMYRLTAEHQKLELTTTERVIQSITGHSTTLFRPPYGGDVEPTTSAELSPLLTAAGMHYITVGEKNDPQDYRLFETLYGDDNALDFSRTRPFEEIVKSVIDNRDVGTTVLLHDAGGSRRNTVAALPGIIEGLRARGYKFCTVADLRFPEQTGKIAPAQMRAELMPALTGRDTILVGADRYVFGVSYLVQRVLSTLFILSLILGVSRVAIFVALALVQRVREKHRVYPIGFAPYVSVVIAAYNEEKVVNRTIAAILEGEYKNLEVIVVDDGSKDRTFDVVKERYGSDPRVTAFRKPNGGKASALNIGIAKARGEIYISLDADTLFAPDTIARLVRHFNDPRVGAVSGNVRVGNINNIWTRWQALEYITSQNFDRRAYDLLNCITVVPGAVGALRRDAVLAVGGYTRDTLAEDTDLTWKLRRADWRIVNDNSALAYTEAPEDLKSLAKQRYRWAFGTLQCLWKHRPALLQHGAFGWIALPSLWLYQMLFPAISPIMDVYLVYSLFAGNFARVGVFYLCMFAIELMAALLATTMDRSGTKLLPWLFFQKFLYRQLMYYVVLKSLVSAIRGGAVGWNKLERTGAAKVG